MLAYSKISPLVSCYLGLCFILVRVCIGHGLLSLSLNHGSCNSVVRLYLLLFLIVCLASRLCLAGENRQMRFNVGWNRYLMFYRLVLA